MSENTPNNLKSFEKGQGKDNHFKSQEKAIFQYLQEHTATASMVSKALDMPQKNICRAKRDLEKRGLLQEVERKLCQITSFKAYYLTTNKELFKV